MRLKYLFCVLNILLTMRSGKGECIFQTAARYSSNKITSYATIDEKRLEPACQPGKLMDLISVTGSVLSNVSIPCLDTTSLAEVIAKKVVLKGLKINIIEEDTFSHMKSELIILSLEENKIKTLRENVFLGLDNLVELNLGLNCLEEVPSAALGHLRSLTHLLLHGNKIKEIKDGDFHGQVHLEFLYVSYNMIEHISYASISDLVSLQEFDIHNNRMVCDCQATWIRTFMDCLCAFNYDNCTFPEEFQSFMITNYPDQNCIVGSNIPCTNHVTCQFIDMPTTESRGEFMDQSLGQMEFTTTANDIQHHPTDFLVEDSFMMYTDTGNKSSFVLYNESNVTFVNMTVKPDYDISSVHTPHKMALLPLISISIAAILIIVAVAIVIVKRGPRTLANLRGTVSEPFTESSHVVYSATATQDDE